MRPLATKLAEDTDLSFCQNAYDVNGKWINPPTYDVQTLIPPNRKHTYAPDIEPTDLIHEEAVFQALTGIDWTTVDFQPLGGEKEAEPAQEDPQPSHESEEES